MKAMMMNVTGRASRMNALAGRRPFPHRTRSVRGVGSPPIATSATSATTTTTTTTRSFGGVEREVNVQPWRDPAMRQYMFWNREDSPEQGKYNFLIEFSPESVVRSAKIVSLSSRDDAANEALHGGRLPPGAQLLGIGTSVDDFIHLEQQKPNVLFVSPSCPHAATALPRVLKAFPSIQWVHCRSAGIDFVDSKELVELCNEDRPDLRMTNAKGQFSSSLAEYAIMACSYFAKDLPRLMKQQANREWIKYDVEELRGKTLGIIGYGKKEWRKREIERRKGEHRLILPPL